MSAVTVILLRRWTLQTLMKQIVYISMQALKCFCSLERSKALLPPLVHLTLCQYGKDQAALMRLFVWHVCQGRGRECCRRQQTPGTGYLLCPSGLRPLSRYQGDGRVGATVAGTQCRGLENTKVTLPGSFCCR